MQLRFQRGIALALNGTRAWPSYRGVLVLFLVARLLLSFGLHLSSMLASVFTMENLAVPYADTVAIFMINAIVGFLASLVVCAPIDRLPVLPLVLAACALGSVLRLLLAWGGPTWMPRVGQLLIVCATLPVNDALFKSTVPVALKRILAIEYANDRRMEQSRRNFFVALFYALHNIGDIVAHGVYYRWRVAPSGPLAANTNVLYLSAAMLVATAACVLWMRRLGPRSDRPMRELTEPAPYMNAMKEARFWRYFGVVLALAFVSSMFQHFELTLTKHLLLEFGPTSPFPLVQSINPAIVVVFAPLLQWLLDRWVVDPYDILVGGATVSALGCLLIGLLQMLPLVSPIAAYSVGLAVFSLGEAAWSPRLLAYGLDVAPEGSEAVYQTIAEFPILLAMLIGPIVSHALIDAYCTQTHCNGAVIWSILGLVAAGSPILLTLARRWLRET